MRLPKSSVLLKQIPDKIGIGGVLPDYAHPLDLLSDLGAFRLVQGQLTEASIFLQNSDVWQQATQISLRNIIAGVGIPAGPIANSVVDILGAFDPRLSSEQRLEQIAGSVTNALITMTPEILEDAIDAGVGVATDLAAAIPIVGFVVKIIWMFGKAAYQALHSPQPEELFPAAVFNPITDNQYLNSMLLQLAGHDWSTLFYPPSLGKDASWKKPINVYPLEGGGMRFQGSTTPGHKFQDTDNQWLYRDPWMGFVPGTSWLHTGIETRHHDVLELGAIARPAAQKQCIWLWSNVAQLNSASAFTIHCDDAEAFWQQYIEDLRLAIRASPLSAAMKAKIFKFYDKQWVPATKTQPAHVSKVFGWGDGSKEVDYAPGPLLRTLRQRQLAFCDTLTVAYVDSSFGAAEDPVVRAKINKRQADLLQHPAVCAVDLSNVQDVLLHDEIVDRRKGYNCLVAGNNAIAQAFTPGTTPPKPPEIPHGMAMPDPSGLVSGGGPWKRYAAGAVALAAAGALGYHCRKDLQRTIRKLRRQIPL